MLESGLVRPGFKMVKKIFSVDAEVDGLYGFSFAIAVTVREWLPEVPGSIAQTMPGDFEKNRRFSWRETARFEGRIPDSLVDNEWVRKNVLPTIAEMAVTHNSSEELEEAFWDFWMKHKDGSTVIAHCGSPVESGMFRRCVERNLAGRQWNGPYPAIHDLATVLLALGEQADSADAYIKKYGLTVPFQGATHHPSYDAIVAATVWEHAWERLTSGAK